MLEQHHSITSNCLLHDDRDSQFNREQIYVPLALVEKKKPDKKEDKYSPEAGSKLYEPQYEEKQRFEHQAWLQQILEKGESKTKGKRIALIGEPGAGKTTTLQDIAFWVLEKKLGLPIWISLADLGRNKDLINLQTYVLENWLNRAVSPSQQNSAKQELETQIQQGQVWLLLDGVDEVATSGVEILQHLFQQLTGWLARARVLLTCRLNVWQADLNFLSDFETYRLLDFDYPQQVHQFIENWFSQRDISKGERLKTELHNPDKARLRDLIQNPLRLMLLCSSWQSNEANLPDTKAELYAQFVQQFYQWKSNRFPRNTRQQKELNRALGSLAIKDIDCNNSRFRLRESFISQELGCPGEESSLFYRALKLGWLNCVGVAAESSTKEKVYAFFHPTFEEYFAACAIDDWNFFLPRNHVNEPVRNKKYRIFELHWKEVILLWLGRENITDKVKEDLINALINFEDGCNSIILGLIPKKRRLYQYLACFIAVEATNEFDKYHKTKEVFKKIVDLSLNESVYQIQYLTQKILTKTNKTATVAALVDVIDSTKNEFVFNNALDFLEKIDPGNKSVIAALLDIINSTNINEHHLSTALDKLMKIAPDNEKVISTLVYFINDGKYSIFRNRAAMGLDTAVIKNKKDVASLIETISFSKNEYAREIALTNLKKKTIQNQKSIPSIVGLIDFAEDESILREIAKKLGETKVGAIGNEKTMAITALFKLFNYTKDNFTRITIAESLSKIAPENQKLFAILIELNMSTDLDSFTFWRLERSLKRIDPDGEKTILAFVELIRSSINKPSCRIAVERLERFCPINKKKTSISYATATLVDLINSAKNNITRIEAAKTLLKIHPQNQKAFATLIDSINYSFDEFIRIKAAESLLEIDPENQKAFATLIDLIDSTKNKFIRIKAAESLLEIDPENEGAISALVNLICFSYFSRDKSIFVKSVNSLGKIAPGNQKAIVALVKLILRLDFSYFIGNQWIYKQAADSLETILTRSAMPKVVNLLRNSSKEEAIKILWQCAQNLSYPEFYSAWHS